MATAKLIRLVVATEVLPFGANVPFDIINLMIFTEEALRILTKRKL